MTRSSSIIKPRSNAKGVRIHHGMPGAVRFCAIDGEGIDRDGSHRYALLGVGNDQLINENGLDWRDVFAFMYSHYSKGTAFVGFFLGYDFNQWFKTLPPERAAMLLTDEGRAKRRRRGKNPAPFPVECQGWEFDMLGMKRLKLRPKSCEHKAERGVRACKCRKHPWMYVCDVGGFFQQSFLSVINPKGWKEPVVTPEEYATIEEGKAGRSDQYQVTPDMRRYNALENETLCRVLGALDAGLRDIGVYLPPSKWFGPGQSAQAWLVNEGVKRSRDIRSLIPDWFYEAALSSYFGGWFELMMHGLIKGPSHEYDINNAYPYIISKLPCLEHGEYTRGQGVPTVKEGELCLIRARIWSRAPSYTGKQYIGAMLHREPNDKIHRPTVTEGWFWWHEIQAAIRGKCVQPFRSSSDRLHPRCYEWVKYNPCKCPAPMARIVELYARRLAMGKDSPLGKAAKTTYNSAYGKFAQSVGTPVFGNAIYASLITAGCRTMILDAIASHPIGAKDVAMVATDAVYFVHPHPKLPVSERLGEWSHKERTNLCLFKPGVYWDDASRQSIMAGETPSLKSRGLSARDFGPQIERIDKQFAEWGNGIPSDESWPMVQFRTAFSMVTCLQAIQRNDWGIAGYVSSNETRRQTSTPYDKRTSPYYDEEYRVVRTEPRTPEYIHKKNEQGEWHAYWDCTSSPYTKRIGPDDPFSDESRSVMGMTPDGNAYDLIGYAWKELASQ
jgi:hypothetical protein